MEKAGLATELGAAAVDAAPQRTSIGKRAGGPQETPLPIAIFQSDFTKEARREELSREEAVIESERWLRPMPLSTVVRPVLYSLLDDAEKGCARQWGGGDQR